MAETNGGRRAETFADALAELKRRGSMLLLAGQGHGALEATCDQLLGATGPGDRRRLFVVTDPSPTHASPADPGARTVSYEAATRSAAAAPTGDASVSDRHVEGDLGDLQSAVTDVIEGIDREVGGLDPAELRICIDSADSLLAASERERFFRFVHALTGVVRGVNAMCHVHLPVAFDAEEVQLLTPLFDAVIETRTGGHQRWHLREPELTTDWLAP
jgi:hypothetical protein